MDLKIESRMNGLSLSITNSQACLLRPSCDSTIHVNQGDLVLKPDMDACKTTPEPYLATIKIAHPLNQVLENVPFFDSIFRATQLVQLESQSLRVYNWDRLNTQTLDAWIQKLCKNSPNQFLHIIHLSILQLQRHSKTLSLTIIVPNLQRISYSFSFFLYSQFSTFSQTTTVSQILFNHLAYLVPR